MSRSTRLYGSDVAVGVCSPRFPSPARRARPAGVLLEQCHDHRFFAQGGREGGREGSEVGTGARGV